VTGEGARRIGAVAAVALAAAAALASGAASATPVSYTCTGTAATDQAALQPLIAAGGAISLHGPQACVGNFVAAGVSLTIAGAGSGVTMDGAGTGSIFLLDDATVTLSNLTLTHGRGSGPDEPDDPAGKNGGAVSMGDSALTLDHCRVAGNHADDQGGGIHAAESTVTILDSSVSENTSEEGGGGIDADDDVDLTIAHSTFSGNTTGPHGGGIELFDGTLTVTDSTISGNSVTDSADFRSGGGIWSGLSSITLTRTTVSNNSSTEFGGGIGFSGGPGSSLTIRDSTLSGNRAALGGGAIRNDAYYGDAPLVVDRSTIAGNVAAEGGGIDNFGLHGFVASVSITTSTVAGNRAPGGLGGAINSFVDPSGGATSIATESSTIGARRGRLNDGNQASWGGAIAANGDNGPATISLRAGTVLVANVARFDGGGVFTRNGATLAVGPGVQMLLNRPNNVN
jgi:parallel beta helix pectate lyase-like protein